MKPAALAISPHLDDAAFSCGGTLAALATAGWRVIVATVFTASVPDPTGFALACQLDKGLPADIDYMALRRAEDAAAVAALGAEAEWLPFAEAPHRGYSSAAALFGPTREDDGIVEPVAAALGGLLDRHRPDLVLAPQGVGGHVDHVQVVRALRAASPDSPVLWWRDFPYAAREATPSEPFATAMADRPEVTIAPDAASSLKKGRACLAYASQLGFQFGGPEGLGRALAMAGSDERFRAEGRLPEALAAAGLA